MKRLVPLALVLALAACSNDAQKDAPEPKPSDITNGTHTQVIQMPDGFRNVAFTCYGSTGIYVTSRGVYEASGVNVASLPSSIAAVPNDPHCVG